MNIQQVRDNLIKTIEGKEKYLEEVRKARSLANREEDNALFATQEFLKLNIDELRKILKDVTICCVEAVEAEWIKNPDRMGGQFTHDEIDNHGRWI